jgi:hypothetical protein
MPSIGATLILLGFSLALFAQMYGAARTLRTSAFDAILCLLVPGHVLFVAKRDHYYRQVVALWSTGILCIAIGTIALS